MSPLTAMRSWKSIARPLTPDSLGRSAGILSLTSPAPLHLARTAFGFMHYSSWATPTVVVPLLGGTKHLISRNLSSRYEKQDPSVLLVAVARRPE